MSDPTPATLDQARAWMRSAFQDSDEDSDDRYSDCDGTTLLTPLAEDCANALDLALDDAEATIPQWVFDLAYEVGEWWDASWEEDEDDTSCTCPGTPEEQAGCATSDCSECPEWAGPDNDCDEKVDGE